ncbi:MAG: DMT family transporter [Actinomycetota bacterium]|nr:DMT family transporter [Actinomycetota bacterium]
MSRESVVGGGRRGSGVALAGLTAVVSGVSVFVNGYGVRAVPDAAVYTTAKNALAAVVLLLVVAAVPALRSGPLVPGSATGPGGRPGASSRAPRRIGRALGLAYVAAVGGGVAFVLFFTGLAHSASEPAAFVHDTLVLWVGAVAWRALGERLAPVNLLAIGALLAGQVVLSGGVGRISGTGGLGLVLAATLLWSVEVVVAKRLLAGVAPGTVALVRMGGGSLLLVAYLALDGRLGALAAMDAHEVAWVAATGVLLAAYVATWFAALARARAVDVTSILVGSVLVTAALQAAAGHPGVPVEPLGIGLVALGAAAVLVRWPRRAAA